jgi:hypothetical protein
MLEGKLARLRELLDTKERVDAELEQLLGGTEQPKAKRGRPSKEKANGALEGQQDLPV